MGAAGACRATLVRAPVEGTNCNCAHGRGELCVVFLCVFLVLVVSFYVLGLGQMIFLEMGKTESTPLNILRTHWKEVKERGENLL